MTKVTKAQVTAYAKEHGFFAKYNSEFEEWRVFPHKPDEDQGAFCTDNEEALMQLQYYVKERG
jgi:hypothetical protein